MFRVVIRGAAHVVVIVFLRQDEPISKHVVQ